MVEDGGLLVVGDELVEDGGVMVEDGEVLVEDRGVLVVGEGVVVLRSRLRPCQGPDSHGAYYVA